MKTTEQGQLAESAVAEYLETQGYQIIACNWRTKVCEIDLVAKKKNVVYFVEVKFRIQASQGDGFEYITTKKLKQMIFASRVWCQENNWDGDARLLAAAVSGENCKAIELIEVS